MDAYITDLAAFLPNHPVGNDEIESVLGRINHVSSKTRRIVLKNNGIRSRYYAIDPPTGRLTHTNAQLTAEAIRRLCPHPDFSVERIECLCCGTTSPDILFPGHGLMVLGELGVPECEAVSMSGICISGMNALKYACLSVAAGDSANAVATGSELSGSFMRAPFFVPFLADDPALENRPIKAFDADFLRWMLSDGAGAAYVVRDRPPDRAALKVEWIETVSYAGRIETCMYGGGVKNEDGSVTGWRAIDEIDPAQAPYRFCVRQDIRLLDREILRTMGWALRRAADKHGLEPETVDWFLPHYSSAYFRPKFMDEMARIGFTVPEDRWFTNLPEKGNTGSAAIFIILEELFHSGRLTPGQRILCFIPESGRFSHCFMLLTAC